MHQFLVTLLVALLTPVLAAQDHELPRAVRGFSGQVIGQVTDRHDDGSFSLRVLQVTRVWKTNAATDLEWFVGRTLRVGPRWQKGEEEQWRPVETHVQFIRQLRAGEDLRVEIKHAEHDRFAILELSEAQRQSLAGERAPARVPTGLPADARGFSGQVGGIVRGRNDDGSVQLEVVAVLHVWEGSAARHPEALVGQIVRVTPRWVQGEDERWRPVPAHVAFLKLLTVGEDYRLELKNAERDHLQLLELSKEQRQMVEQHAK